MAIVPSRLVTRFFCVFGLALSAPIAALADLPFVTGITGFGVQDHSLTAGVGFQFSNLSGQPVVVTQLGRYVLAGNVQPHVLSIYDTSGNQLAAVTVNCAGATPGQFLYGTLATPYSIAPGAVVYFMSAETNGGDLWFNNNNTVITITPALSFVQSAYYLGGASFTIAGNNGGPSTSAGPVSFQYTSPLSNWTKSGTVYTTDGSPYSIASAVADASTGDTVTIPAGTFTWGSFGSPVMVNKPIVLAGTGQATTTINIATTAPTFSSGGAIALSAAAILRDFTLSQTGGVNTTGIKADTTDGWRITRVTYNSGPTAGYFVYAGSYGLIDNCTINGGAGSDEWIFVRGPNNSWHTASSLGTANSVYLEDNIFNLQGYPDFNSNARGVVRFNTINATTNLIKIDAHGYTTNTPPRSAREMEIYHNTWTANSGSQAFEMRGGTGMIFDNVSPSGGFFLEDYGILTNLSNYGRYQTPVDYPLIDQIGVGQDPKTGGSEPYYVFNNFSPNGVTPWARTINSLGTPSSYTTNSAGYSIGATVITLTAGGGGSGSGFIGTGDAVAFSGDSNRYLVTSGVGQNTSFPATITIAGPGLLQAIPAAPTTMTSGPLTLYQFQTGNPAATFTERSIVQANRDFFADAGFDGPGNIGRGTKAAMLATNPATAGAGAGWWVTDEGSWNITLPVNTSGQLYVSNGAAWVLKYTPFTYPHPLRRPLTPSKLLIGP